MPNISIFRRTAHISLVPRTSNISRLRRTANISIVLRPSNLRILGRVGLVLLLAVGIPSPAFSTTPFDDYGNLCWEEEKLHLDNFAIQMQNDLNLVGRIVVFAGRISCQGEAKYRGQRALDWVKKRGIAESRVKFVDGGFKTEVMTSLVLKSKDGPEREFTNTLEKSKVSIKRCVDKTFARKICLNLQ